MSLVSILQTSAKQQSDAASRAPPQTCCRSCKHADYPAGIDKHMAVSGICRSNTCRLPGVCQVYGCACMQLLSANTVRAQALAHSTGRLVAAILTGIEDATIGTIISWLALREKLPSAQSLSSLGVLAAQVFIRLGFQGIASSAWLCRYMSPVLSARPSQTGHISHQPGCGWHNSVKVPNHDAAGAGWRATHPALSPVRGLGTARSAHVTCEGRMEIKTVISWLALREKLPSAQSLSSLGVLAAQALAGMRSRCARRFARAGHSSMRPDDFLSGFGQ